MKEITTQQNNPSDVWEWVKYRLALKGYSFGKFALIHKVKKTNFTNVKSVHIPKYEHLIADYIGVDPWELWPDRYDAAHNPNHVSSRYQGYKSLVEHASKEINGKVVEGK